MIPDLQVTRIWLFKIGSSRRHTLLGIKYVLHKYHISISITKKTSGKVVIILKKMRKGQISPKFFSQCSKNMTLPNALPNKMVSLAWIQWNINWMLALNCFLSVFSFGHQRKSNSKSFTYYCKAVLVAFAIKIKLL